MTKEEKVDRRTWLKVTGGTVAGLAIGGAIGYFAKPTEMAPPTTVTRTATETVTITGTAPPPKDIVLERAVKGIQDLIAAGKVPKGTVINFADEAGMQENAVRVAGGEFYKHTPFTRDDFDIQVIGIPYEGLYDKFISEAMTKTGAYDVLYSVTSNTTPDMVEVGVLRPIEDYLAKYDPDGQMRNSFVGKAWNYQAMCKGRIYGLPGDADVLLLNYRKDIIGHPEEKDNFKARYGYELRPPVTWKEYYDVAEFFTRKAGDKAAGQTLDKDMYGHLEWRLKFLSEQWYWMKLATVYDDPSRTYIDPDTLEPTINSPEAVEVLEYMGSLNKFMEPGWQTHGFGDHSPLFNDGRAVMWVMVTSGPKLSQQPDISKVVGKVGCTVHPYWNRERYYLLAGSGSTCGISNYSKNQELAWLANQAIHSPTLNWYVWGIWETNMTVCVKNLMEDPRIRAGQWADFTMDPILTNNMLDAVYKSAVSGFPEFVVPGYRTFMEFLTTNTQKYYNGDVSAQKAMDDTAKSWAETIDRIGKDKIRKYYSELVKQMPP